jgi:hypothetical protein
MAADEVQRQFKLVRAEDKTYIVQKNQHGKWEHLVSVYAKQTPEHLRVSQQIWEALPMSKAQAVLKRNAILEVD